MRWDRVSSVITDISRGTSKYLSEFKRVFLFGFYWLSRLQTCGHRDRSTVHKHSTSLLFLSMPKDTSTARGTVAFKMGLGDTKQPLLMIDVVEAFDVEP